MTKKTPHHIEAQRKIDVEQTAWVMLGNIIMFDGKWTSENLKLKMKVTNEIFRCAKEILVTSGFVTENYLYLYRTTAGEIAYTEVARSPAHFITGESFFRFNDEALSNMDDEGNRSEIDNPALPSKGRVHKHKNKIEDDVLSKIESYGIASKVAKDLGLSIDELNACIKDGSVHECNHGGKMHWGRFHRDRSKRRWQSACIACRKMERGKK